MLLTIKQVATALAVCTETVLRMAARGCFPVVRLTKRALRVERAELQAYSKGKDLARLMAAALQRGTGATGCGCWAQQTAAGRCREPRAAAERAD